MNINLNNKVLFLLVTISLVMIINFILVMDSEKNSDDRYEWVVHTLDVINNSQQLLGYLKDAETGQRGYLLSKDSKYLAPYYDGIEKSVINLNILFTLVQDNPSQQRRLHKIKKLMVDKFYELKATIRLSKNNKHDEALSIVTSDKGKIIMDNIRAHINEFIAEENELLELRKKNYQSSIEKLHLWFLIEAALSLSIFIYVIIWFQNKLIKPIINLRKHIMQVGENDSNIYEPVYFKNNNELNVLANAFNRMHEKVVTRTLQYKNIQNNLEEEVSVRAKKYKIAKEEAVAASQAKSQFLSSMSHELRTPLNAVLGFAQLLEMDEKDETKKKNIQEIIVGGNHLLVLVNEVLDLVKIESGSVELSTRNHSLHKVIDESLSMIKPLADKHTIQIDDKLSSLPDINIRVDEMRFKQVLLNILSNAIKYNSDKGAVTIDGSSTDENMFNLSITDTGNGFTAEQLSHLFEPFERFGAANSNIEGAGLGLVIAKDLLELMDGTITVESEFGKGSQFIIKVPLT